MKHFINLKDIPAKDLRRILIDAKKRKKARKKLNNLDHDKGMPLKGKLLIQMFEKSSLRTRLSFFLAISQLSGRTLTLRPDELHLSKGGESIEDTAKILSSFGDAFMLRTDNDEKLEEFKKHLTIPIINGLSPSSHPTQILSDVFTVEEIKKKPISKLNITWIGDSNNVLNSLIAASIKFSFKLKVGCPKKYKPNQSIMNYIKKNKNKRRRKTNEKIVNETPNTGTSTTTTTNTGGGGSTTAPTSWKDRVGQKLKGMGNEGFFAPTIRMAKLPYQGAKWYGRNWKWTVPTTVGVGGTIWGANELIQSNKNKEREKIYNQQGTQNWTLETLRPNVAQNTGLSLPSTNLRRGGTVPSDPTMRMTFDDGMYQKGGEPDVRDFMSEEEKQESIKSNCI